MLFLYITFGSDAKCWFCFFIVLQWRCVFGLNVKKLSWRWCDASWGAKKAENYRDLKGNIVGGSLGQVEQQLRMRKSNKKQYWLRKSDAIGLKYGICKILFCLDFHKYFQIKKLFIIIITSIIHYVVISIAAVAAVVIIVNIAITVAASGLLLTKSWWCNCPCDLVSSLSGGSLSELASSLSRGH